MASSNFVILTVLLLSLLLLPASCRPAVRTIRDTSQFDALLKKHSEETGLPVIVDFYSESCGPCRQIAPAYKKLAKEMEGKAVFVKVDVNSQHQLSSRYGVRSMPTFLFFVGGKKFKEFSGAGEQQLRQFTDQSILKAERENVELPFENLMEYYAVNDPMKAEEDVEKVHKACAKQSKAKGACVGGAAAELGRKLNKKYSKRPKTVKRFTPQEKSKEENSEKAEKDAGKQKQKKQSSKNAGSSPLTLSSIPKEDLLAELEKRNLAEAEARDEAEEDDDTDTPPSSTYTPSSFPERVVIIGSGPAGLSAAVYAARAGLKPVVVAPPMGGQLQGKGVDVENYPGLFNVTGPEVVSKMREQAMMFGTVFEGDVVTKIETDERPFKVELKEGKRIETHAVIVATGADSVWLGVEGEYEHRGAGVSSCATCDGHLFRDQTVVVVGGGDSAMEDALVLSRTSKEVVVVVRRDVLRASKVLADRVQEKSNIKIVWNSTVEEIKGGVLPAEAVEEGEEPTEPKKVVKAAVVKNSSTGETAEIACDAVFVAIGHSPNTEFLGGQIKESSEHKGYLAVDGMSSRTSVPGIFAAGDSADAVYRQAITSAGSGAMAALDVERYLSEHGLGNEEEEFERQMMEEMMADEVVDDSGGYNAYENANAGAGRKESSKAPEKPKKEEKKEEVKKEEEDEEHIEL
ncbi:hypothetical protein TrST_g1512 [Triparma strigata]|uniref:Thioredoxin domain-containing protein n=1 Tax=Triparma strigata TaxID=1606541 RepID=A0A9W7BG56_9STRA|nr:hypothetical protein TrST_g1512 [Triparma strigata]